MKVTTDRKTAALHVPQLASLEQVGSAITWHQDDRDWTLVALAGNTQVHNRPVALFDLAANDGTHLIVGRRVDAHAVTLEKALNQMHPGLSAAIGDRNPWDAAEARTALVESHDFVLEGAKLNQLGSDELYSRFLANQGVYDQFDTLSHVVEDNEDLDRYRRDVEERQRRRDQSSQWERSLGRTI